MGNVWSWELESTDPRLFFYCQSERNLSISQGREMSRRQLAQFCGNESDSEDEDGKLEKISSSQDAAEEAAEIKGEVPVEEQSPAPPKEKGEDAKENES